MDAQATVKQPKITRAAGTMSAFEMVRSVVVRPIRSPDEIRRFDALMRAHHYLGLNTLVGENIRCTSSVFWGRGRSVREPKGTKDRLGVLIEAEGSK
jgi:hypothetical protein